MLVTALTITVAEPDSIWIVLTAIGTVGAVVVALYVSVWRDYRRRPKLSLEFDPAPESADIQILDTAPFHPQPQQAWVRLRVISERRRSAAEEAEVMIVAARETGPRQPVQLSPGLQAIHTRASSLPIPIEGQLLIWSNSEQVRLNIPPGIHRHVDLLCVTRGRTDDDRFPRFEDGCVIQVKPTPTDLRHHVRASRFYLELAITARNADARRYGVEVSFDGQWGDDREAIREHLAIEIFPVTPLRQLTAQHTDPTRAARARPAAHRGSE
jgi:hypothetical protein